MASVFPFSAVTSVPVLSSASPSSRRAGSSVHPFPAAAPVIPPPAGRVFFRRPETLCRRGPNHALQRTEAGRHVFSRWRLLRGQPLSLSLGPLGPLIVTFMPKGRFPEVFYQG